jgi:hypothetical protein
MIQKHNKPEEAHTGTPGSEGLERIEELIGLGRYRDARREPIEARSEQARRRAAYVLEVLGGRLTPQQAADGLSITVPRYYTVEERAIRGLAAACEPLPQGPAPKPEQEIAKLSKRCTELENELIRFQALSRAAHRAIGLDLQAPTDTTKGKKGKRKRRKPVVRALRASARLTGKAQTRAKKPEKPKP